MKKLYLFSSVAFMLCMLLWLSPCANAQGGTLPLNTSVNGNLTSATPDVYDITTTGFGLLRLTFTTVSPADLFVTLFDNNGVTALSSQTESFNNSTVVVPVDGLAPGTYHIKITAFNTAFGAYTLSDSLFVSPVTSDAEPNSTLGGAVNLPLNGSKTGHVGYYYNNLRDTIDMFKITTNADGRLAVFLSTSRSSVYSINPLDVNLTVYDNDGTTQLGIKEVFSGNNPTFDSVTIDGLEPGTYYIKVQPFSTNEFADYTISNILLTPPLANDAEPNGMAATAVTLPLNGSKTGHVGYYYNGARDTTDWYKVTATADGLLKVFLTTARGSILSNNSLDVNVTVYDNDGTTQLGAKEVFLGNNPTSDSITIDGLEPGTYYIKVQPFSTIEFADYTISNILLTPPLANDAEPNGTAATAVTLPLNGSKTGHVGYYYNNARDTTDWYKITTTADGLLKIFLTTARGSVYSNNNLDVNVTVYDNDGTTQLGAKEVFLGNNPTSDSITIDGLEPGTYYIKVQPFSTNEFADYTISNTSLTPPLANDTEPNGSAATATILPLNGSKTGHVGYYYNNARDTTDWYQVTTSADGLLKVFLSTERGSVYSNNNLDVNLTVYDNDGTIQLSAKEVFLGNNPTSDSVTIDGLEPGTYYIKVQPFSTNEFADYTISDTLVLPRFITDAEPNGSAATAINLPINTSNTKGHSGYYYNNQRDTADWYKVTTTSTGPLRIVLNTSRGSIYSSNSLDFNIFLYNSDGTTQIGSKEVFNGNNPATDSLVVSGLAAGTYYIKIQPFSTSEFGDYSLADLNASGTLLPVSFLNFDGTLVDNKALLKWSTATEINNKGFEVEKSGDGQNFASIGFVQGHGTSSAINNYDYTDIKVLSGYNYYRLKQVDIDGNFNYSSVIRLDFKNFDWAILGNPVSAGSWMQLQMAKTSKVAIQIVSIDGKILQTINKGTISEGTYSFPLSLGNIPSGIYIVRLWVNNQVYSKKVIK